MGKQFVRTADADKRAIQLHHQLQAVKEMPLISIQFHRDGKTIIVADRDEILNCATCSVDVFLSFDVQEAKDKGSTWEALLTSRKRARPRVSQAEVDEEVRSFLSGERTSRDFRV